MGLHSSHPLTELIADFVMSSTSTAVNTFNKSKEDFIWFVKKAVQDKKSYSYSELYHSLLKIFVDADTNRDGLVSKASFSKLIVIYTRLRRKKMLPDRRCSTPWISRLLVSSPLMNGWRSSPNMIRRRLVSLRLIPSLQ